jgi:hypothetical protein
MSNGQACFQIEDRASAGDSEASPPMSGVRENERTLHVVDGRCAAATVPGAGVDRFAATFPVVDEPLPAYSPEWCVDLGANLVTKSTFALWTAIERGEVGGNMLVWREGMECWTPINRVGELAYAIEPVRPTVPEPSPEENLEASPDASLEASPEATEATTNPELRRRPPVADPPRISSRRQVPFRTGGGGKWIALGSAVAVSAISAAALTTFLTPPPAAESSGSRGRPAAPVIHVMERAALSRDEPEPSVIAPPAIAPPAIAPVTAASLPAKARHEDRGQHRRRSGDRR